MLMFNCFLNLSKSHLRFIDDLWGLCVSLAAGPDSTGPPCFRDFGPDRTGQPGLETIIYKLKWDIWRGFPMWFAASPKSSAAIFDSNPNYISKPRHMVRFVRNPRTTIHINKWLHKATWQVPEHFEQTGGWFCVRFFTIHCNLVMPLWLNPHSAGSPSWPWREMIQSKPNKNTISWKIIVSLCPPNPHQPFTHTNSL